METKKMTKSILDFQKDAISQWCDVIMSMQKQAASSMASVLDQSDWIPKEGRQIMQGWVNVCEKGCKDYRDLMEESINGLEKVLVVPSRKPAAKRKSAPKPASTISQKKATAAAAKPAEPVQASEAAVSTKETAADRVGMPETVAENETK